MSAYSGVYINVLFVGYACNGEATVLNGTVANCVHCTASITLPFSTCAYSNCVKVHRDGLLSYVTNDDCCLQLGWKDITVKVRH